MRKFLGKIKDGMIRASGINDGVVTGIKSHELIALNKELSDRVNELKTELDIAKEDLEIRARELLRQSQLRQQAETREYRLESRKAGETKINSDAIDDKLVMQGVIFRAREVSTAMVPLLEGARDALLELPAPQTEEQQDAITTLNESLSMVNRYANMIGNDNKGTKNLLITTGMMDEKAKQAGESVMQSDEAEVLRLFLEKKYKTVVVLDYEEQFTLVVGLTDGSLIYKGEFPTDYPPEKILRRIKRDLAAARADHLKDCVPEGSGQEYDDGPFQELTTHGETRP